jgi:hypothetical protein
MTVNNTVVNTVVNQKELDILQYCESIISDTENIQEFVNEEYLDNQEFFVIRQNAEYIQNIVVDYITLNLSLSNFDKSRIQKLRIEMYQYSKYILESYFEDKNDDIDNLDDNEKFVIKCFKDISNSVSSIDDLIDSVESV